MVRLVFRPYAQFWQSICTSELLRSSIRVSPDFNLIRHSSPSFGSYPVCSWYIFHMNCSICWQKYPGIEEQHANAARSPITVKFFLQISFMYSFTRILDRLLGPCFKTGPKGIPKLTAVDRAHVELAYEWCRNINNMTFKIHQTAIRQETTGSPGNIPDH